MRVKRPRIEPLPEADWDEEIRSHVAKTADGRPLNIFATLANHPKLLKRWMVFANHVLFKSTLPPREREIAILRIGWLCRSGYEWTQHVAIGKQVGLTDQEIRRIELGADAEGWDPFDALILRAVDELKADSFVSEATWQALSERYDTRQLMDLVFAVGQYNLVSMALNSFGVQLED